MITNKKKKEGFGAIGTSLPYKADTTENVLTNTLIMIDQIADQYPITPEALYKIADDKKYCEKDILAEVKKVTKYPDYIVRKGKTFDCEVCFMTYTYKNGYALSCEHYLCF